jgi:hypothetical protein
VFSIVFSLCCWKEGKVASSGQVNVCAFRVASVYMSKQEVWRLEKMAVDEPLNVCSLAHVRRTKFTTALMDSPR